MKRLLFFCLLGLVLCQNPVRAQGVEDGSWSSSHAGENGVYFRQVAKDAEAAKPDADGFIRRWWVLDPIDKPNRSNTVFTDSYLREAFYYEYFKGQKDYLPKKDGEKVKLYKAYTDKVWEEKNRKPENPMLRQMEMKKPERSKSVLQWHNLESTGFNVHLYRFSSTTKQQVYGVLFWAVTVIECEEDINDVRLAAGSNSASMWWLNGEEVLVLSGDRRMVKDDGTSGLLSLKKGQNILRAAVINGPGMSNFCVRFVGKDGKAIQNFKIVK